MASNLILNTIAFYTIRLELPRGQEKVSNEVANNLLAGVQWLFGQTIVESRGQQFVITPKVQEQYFWLKLALKISACIVFRRIVIPVLLISTALGTVARLYSLGYLDVRQGLFGEKISNKAPPTPPIKSEDSPLPDILEIAQKQQETISHETVLTQFIKSIPVIGNIEEYDHDIEELESFFTEFLEMPDEIIVDLDAMLDMADEEILGKEREEDLDNFDKVAPQDAKHWLDEKFKNKETYFYPFALMRQLVNPRNREYAFELKNIENLVFLYKKIIKKSEILNIVHYINEIHPNTELALTAECKTLNAFLQDLANKSKSESPEEFASWLAKNKKTLEEALLKSHYLIQSQNTNFLLFRKTNPSSFIDLQNSYSACQEIKNMPFLSPEDLSEVISQIDKSWIVESSSELSELDPEDEDHQVSEILKDLLGFFSKILEENNPGKLAEILQANSDPQLGIIPLFSAEVFLQMQDVDPALKSLFKRLDPTLVSTVFASHQKSVEKLKSLKLDRFLPTPEMIQTGLMQSMNFSASTGFSNMMMPGGFGNPSTNSKPTWMSRAASWAYLTAKKVPVVGPMVTAAENKVKTVTQESLLTMFDQLMPDLKIKESIAHRNKQIHDLNKFYDQFFEQSDESTGKWLEGLSQQPDYLYPFLRTSQLIITIKTDPMGLLDAASSQTLVSNFSKCSEKLKQLGLSHYLEEYPKEDMTKLMTKLEAQTAFFQQFFRITQDNSKDQIRSWVINQKSKHQDISPFFRAQFYYSDLNPYLIFLKTKLCSTEENKILVAHREAYNQSCAILKTLGLLEDSEPDLGKLMSVLNSQQTNSSLSDILNFL